MYTRPARHTALAPVLTLGAALVTAVSLMLTAGVDAASIPTPSETSVVTVAPPATERPDDQTMTDLTTTPPTGTTALVAP